MKFFKIPKCDLVKKFDDKSFYRSQLIRVLECGDLSEKDFKRLYDESFR